MWRPSERRRSRGLAVARHLVWPALLACLVTGCTREPPRSGGKSAAYLAEVLQKPDDAVQRRKAAQQLGPLILTDPDALPALLGAVKDADPEVRAAVARSLGIYSGSKASEVLPALHQLQQDPEEKVRTAATQAVKDLAASR